MKWCKSLRVIISWIGPFLVSFKGLQPVGGGVVLYLKKLEIKGFKSFADKVELDFTKGITAIVGPNGSGKSNISDSIRWVLGEQSAKTLRGAKMEDVIFAGTESRKALGCAEVALTIDNSCNTIPLDYSEITIARRLYRSGESEYLLNGTPCRLKDIVEIFMDTGIGKDGYSLIGQGRIDEILSTRSEDRRNLFEEAAGIVKYKTRKQEAERKLENTRQNLIRISDIIRELEGQIEPLYNQSQVAKKYLALREELKELEISVILNNYEEASKKLTKFSSNIEELVEGQASYEKKRDELILSIQNIKKELGDLEKEYEESNNFRVEIEKSHENKQGNLKLLNERHENFFKEKERIKNEINNERERLKRAQELIDRAEEERASIEREVESIERVIEEINKEYTDANEKCIQHERLIEDRKSEAIQILKEISETTNKINSSTIIMNNLESRKIQLERELKSKNEKLIMLNIEIDKTTSIKKHYDEKLLLEKNKLQNELQRLKSLEEELKKLNHSKGKIFEELKTLEARYKTLVDMEKDMEGFNRAVKAIISKFKDSKKVFGTISDLVKVPRGYEVAIEIALGASVQNIVVDNEHTAGDMINYLKNNHLGRATFLPLTTIKGREASLKENIYGIKGFLGIASDIISYDNIFKNAVTNLLGRVLICDDLESAKHLARVTDYNFRIVTLDGDVINSGGSFTGGSSNIKNSGVISRKNEISELTELINKGKDEIIKVDHRINDNTYQINVSKDNIEAIKADIQNLNIKINDEENKMRLYIREKESCEESIKDIQIEMEQIDKEFIKNQDFLKENKLNLERLDKRQKIVEEEISQLQIEYRNAQAYKDHISSKLTEKKIVFAEKSKAYEAIIKNVDVQKKEVWGINNKILNLKGQIDELNNKILNVEEEIKINLSDIQRTAESIVEIKDRVLNLEIGKKELTGIIYLKEKELETIQETLRDITTSIHRLELSKSKTESEMDVLANKLWDEYELSIPQAEKYRKDIKNPAEAARRVNELKNNIKSLGDVNVNSIEEYKRVTERCEFLKLQEKDLHEAETALMDIIDEMTRKMKYQFEEKFKIIRQNFNETFKELFGGGYADLRLEDDDVLNSGIDIIVQPPGKKLQSLSLLSGGERGLAAIALIFAILKMKPTPFCVLDEIEAALDDANVNRFAEFLKNYSSNTQFIIITHRKGSMAAADALYGVTMEEKGVSKTISLKLKGGNN